MSNLISSWQVGPGVWWIQTRDSHIARRLAKRRDTRLVARGVAGGFLRIFELKRPPAFVRNLVARIVSSNEGFEPSSNALQGFLPSGDVKSADDGIKAYKRCRAQK